MNRAETHHEPAARIAPGLLFKFSNDEGRARDGLAMPHSDQSPEMRGQCTQHGRRRRTLGEQPGQLIERIRGLPLTDRVRQIPDGLLRDRRHRLLNMFARHPDARPRDWLPPPRCAG